MLFNKVKFKFGYLLLAVISSISLITYFSSSENSTASISSWNFDEILLDGQINSSFPITFYHQAYVDHRTDPPRLRIFSLNGCINKTHFLLVDLFYEGIQTATRLKVYGYPLEGCPSGFAPARPCMYVAHTFVANVSVIGGLHKVLINMGNRKVNLSVKRMVKKYETGITMCLQPVYYYSLWQDMILYIEAWRAQGATRFIVFYHSATKDARKVFEHYQKLGIIELRSWPGFGTLPSEIADKYPKFLDSVFIFSQLLAMNICILDIETTFGTTVDIDEVLVPRNGTLLEYAIKEMTGTKVGELSFGNHYVAMQPSIYTSNFSGVLSPIFIDKEAPRKYIFNSSVIDLCQVHWVTSFIDKSRKTKNAEGATLHLRFNVKDFKGKILDKPFRFFPNNSTNHIENMHNTITAIFNKTPPTVTSNFIDVLMQCIGRITKKGRTCRSTGATCKADMDKLTEWVYDKTEGLFLSGKFE